MSHSTGDAMQNLSDRMSGEISLLEVILRLSSQEQSMREIKDKLAGIDEIKQAVHSLMIEGKMRKTDFDNFQKANNSVRTHEVLLRLLSGLCLVLFPVILGWAVYTTKQIIDINTKTQVHEIKLRMLEDRYGNGVPTQDSDKPSGHVWYYHSPQRINF